MKKPKPPKPRFVIEGKMSTADISWAITLALTVIISFVFHFSIIHSKNVKLENISGEYKLYKEYNNAYVQWDLINDLVNQNFMGIDIIEPNDYMCILKRVQSGDLYNRLSKNDKIIFMIILVECIKNKIKTIVEEFDENSRIDTDIYLEDKKYLLQWTKISEDFVKYLEGEAR